MAMIFYKFKIHGDKKAPFLLYVFLSEEYLLIDILVGSKKLVWLGQMISNQCSHKWHEATMQTAKTVLNWDIFFTPKNSLNK